MKEFRYLELKTIQTFVRRSVTSLFIHSFRKSGKILIKFLTKNLRSELKEGMGNYKLIFINL
jgi:hypothetical protein